MTSARVTLMLIAVTAVAGCDKVREALPWQGYTIASASMEPTLRKGTRVTGETVKLSDVKRGDILFVRKRGDTYVIRLAGLPGDTIAMVNGQVVLNGKPVAQQPAGRWRLVEPYGENDVARLSERFPGERGRHHIIDDLVTPGDNTQAVVLGDDQYFFLGDNRDHAADSRYDNEYAGLGLISGKDILRRLVTD